MRFEAYAGASVALATSVVLKALHERANFYSACVYLAQSNASIMILTNLVLLVLGCFLFALQKVLYGPLRPIEIEQLYEKAWFAITETCLAMTIFRDEVGAWFIVMFVSLLVGKVWAWIGEGRVDILEQQPPSNPRIFHLRLSSSLALSLLFDAYLLDYAITTVRQQARPNMMVMFAFEFAVLTVSSMSTGARYLLSLRETAVIHKQTSQRLGERRQQRLQERATAIERARENGEVAPEFPPVEEEIDELDIDVPGWEEKGRWVFYLDLATDFLKLILYLTFFCVLCIFYGMPIHIIRDVAMTVRSFYNRVNDFIKYRHATRDMNERYPDATAEEIEREDTCIICREPMRPWQPPEALQGAGPAPMEERLRPKKLPCGHILHFACLRSWLERQQKCPTCRQDVTTSPPQAPRDQNRNARAGNGPNNDRPPQPGEDRGNGNNDRAPRNRVRYVNLGPIRFGFGAGNDPQLLREQLLNLPDQRQPQPPNNAADGGVTRQFGFDSGFNQLPSSTQGDVSAQLRQIERQLLQQTQVLNLQLEQLRVLHSMQRESARLSARQAAVQRGEPDMGPLVASASSGIQGYAASEQQPLGHGHPELPTGVSIPDGWHLVPLTQIAPPGMPSSVQVNHLQVPGLPSMHSGPPINGVQMAPQQTNSATREADSGQALSTRFGETPVNGNLTGIPATSNLQAADTGLSANGHETQSATPPDSQEIPQPVLKASTPNWGSQFESLDEQASASCSENTGDTSAAPQNGHAASEKGKEKAATVEDDPEDSGL